MNEALLFTLSTVTTLFFVVDPMAAAPSFIAMTANDPPAHKRRTAFRAPPASARDPAAGRRGSDIR